MARATTTTPDQRQAAKMPEYEVLRGRIRDVLSWSAVLILIAESPSRIHADAIGVIGAALDGLAGHMSDDLAALDGEQGDGR